MLPELATLREVQDLDTRIGSLDRDLARVPGRLAAIDDEIAAARGRLAATEKELSDTASTRRRDEGELETAEAAVSRYDDQLLTARTNDEYRGLRTQIAATRERIAGIEDRILGLMEDMDRLRDDVAARSREFDAIRVEFETKKADVRKEAARRGAERDRLAEKRKTAADTLPAPVAARYERIRKARGGTAVVVTWDNRCGACSVRMRPQLFEEIRVGRKLVTCEICSRILVFEPPTEEPPE